MKETSPRRVNLTFDLELHPDEEEFHLDISACALVGDDLWLGSDELTSLERLTRDEDGNFSQHASFPLSDYVELPSGRDDEEVDIEGIAYADHALWVVGSHSLKRQKTGGGTKKSIKKLAKMERESNRYLLARIPLVQDPETRRSELCRTCVDPDDPQNSLTAARLFGTGRTDVLVDALQLDDHLARFLAIPCKENGLDLEGIALWQDRVILGLRGPVLGGWAMLLELEMDPISDTVMTLARIGPHRRPYRKHFVDLEGLGIRDLSRSGDDLLILAGPTMDLEGTVRVVRWEKFGKRKKEDVKERDDLEVVLDFASPDIGAADRNHAEGLAVMSEEQGKGDLLVLYDGPGPERRPAQNVIQADIFRAPGLR